MARVFATARPEMIVATGADPLDRIEQRKRMQPGYVALEIAERDALVKVARAARAYEKPFPNDVDREALLAALEELGRL